MPNDDLTSDTAFERVIGSSIKTVYQLRDGETAPVRQPEIDFIDDKEGKPTGIHKFIGRRPIAAFGNSDGDLRMLQATTAGDGHRLGLIVHPRRRRAGVPYDRNRQIGHLDQALDFAGCRAGSWCR